MSDAENKKEEKDLRDQIAEKGKAAADAVKLAKKMGLIEKVVPKKKEGGGGSSLKTIGMTAGISFIVGVIVGVWAQDILKTVMGFLIAALIIAVVGWALYWFWWKKPADG